MTPTQFVSALERLALTQGQAADELGLTIKTINNYANGRQPIPRVVELALAFLLTQRRRKGSEGVG